MSFFNQLLGKVLGAYIRPKGKKRLAQHAGTIAMKGLSAPVEVRRDSLGVPHIYAENRKDLLFAQGFVHAQDRLWQMEVNRRVCLGRLCEVFGKDALDVDRMTRTFGFGRVGKDSLKLVPEDMQTLLGSYVKGVNAFLSHPDTVLPVEFSLVKHTPEPWKVEHVLAFSSMMLLQMSNGWAHEYVRSKLIEALGPEKAAELEINYPEGNPVAIPKGIEANALADDGKLQALGGPFMPNIKGSNAWAVTGSRTETGKPILCNDPHLPMYLPSIWYQNHLSAPDYNVIGVSLPGLPMVMIGHNEKISWGITLAYTDIEDLFVEKFEDASLKKYEYKGAMLESEIHEEKIFIKGNEEPHIEKVVITRNGPVISDIFETGNQKLVIKAPAIQANSSTLGFFSLNTATGWNDFVEGMRHVKSVGLNIVYADVDGNIGYWVTGENPIRGKGQGDVPAPAWTGEYDWTGYVPFEQMPHNLNPERGYIISCNHKIVPDDYPYFLGRIWMNGHRAKRLENLFSQKETFRMHDFRKMMMDFYCAPGVKFAHLYAGFSHESPAVAEAAKAMIDWDGNLTKDCIGGTIFQVTRNMVLKSIFGKGLSKENTHYAMGTGVDPVLFGISEYMGHDSEMLFRMVKNPDSWFMKAAGGWEKIRKEALEQAVVWLQKELGADISAWRWGAIHKVEFPHSMAIQKPMDQIFNVGPFEIGGDTDTVCQTALAAADPYFAKIACPSYRQIIDMSDVSKSMWVLPPGQSGQLGSSHYKDQAEAWLEGRMYPMWWTRDQVEKDTVDVLILGA